MGLEDVAQELVVPPLQDGVEFAFLAQEEWQTRWWTATARLELADRAPDVRAWPQRRG